MGFVRGLRRLTAHRSALDEPYSSPVAEEHENEFRCRHGSRENEREPISRPSL